MGEVMIDFGGNHLSLVSSFGPAGEMSMHENGGIYFSNPTAGSTFLEYGDYVAEGGGGNLLKNLTDITGWASTIVTGGEMDWNSMTEAQQQKVAYNMQKSLKSNGTRMYTRDIKAKINGNFKSLNYKFGFASGVLIRADILAKGEIRPSHAVNALMTGVGLTVWSSPVAAGYF